MDKLQQFVVVLEARIKQHKEYYQNAINNKDSLSYEEIEHFDLFKGAIHEAEMIETAIKELKKEYGIK